MGQKGEQEEEDLVRKIGKYDANHGHHDNPPLRETFRRNVGSNKHTQQAAAAMRGGQRRVEGNEAIICRASVVG
ncbi:hypothetical protein E2C01_005307 [Portunus trituberculatus]|uniref:Uncharacterized protein n=1 Tax=Portunus trituberculatus TaxID=210409 RepID=A0A5B7CV70_PORTR|nr:hypothetical protein [Portunus trituberculatus]